MKVNAEIHDALETIEVPEPPADFFDQLESRLAASVDEPVLTPVSQRHTARRRIATASLIAVAAAVVLFATVLPMPRTNHTEKQIATAPTQPSPTPTTEIRALLVSQVLARADSSLASVSTLQADATFVQHPYAIGGGGETLPGYTAQGKVLLRNDGRYLATYSQGPNEENSPEVDSYDPASDKVEQCRQPQPGAWACSATTGVVPTDSLARLPLGRGNLSALLRNAVADDSQGLKEVTFDNRPAWQLHASIPNGAFYADAATITVDEQSGMAVDIVMTSSGKPFSETTLHNVALNVPLDNAQLTLTEPKGAQINQPDSRNFTPTSIDKVASLVGYTPFVPNLDANWTLAQVNVAKSDGIGPEGPNPQGIDVVTLTYRSGLQSVTFTTRLRGSGNWIEDPLYVDGDPTFGAKTATLTDGSFQGMSSKLETELDSEHLWGIGQKYVVAIAGDMTSDQLTTAANSLHPFQAG